MALTLESLTGGEAREVKIGDLEKELSALWRSVAREAKGSEAVMRSTALTLLVHAESEESAQEIGKITSALTEQNPCRAVIMIAQPEAKPAGLTARISLHCRLPAAGRKQVCCEQIAISARGEAVRDLDNLVLSLAVSGLPVCLWWRGGRFDPSDYLDRIVHISNRVIVDSARFGRPESDLAALARHVAQLSDHMAFLDLNWARITPWRELIAQCFDPPRARGYLEKLRRVRIEYEQDSVRVAAQGAQALLLAGWLASRLKWQPGRRPSEQHDGIQSFFLESPQGEVEIQRVARRFEGDGRGVCFSIALEAAHDAPATFSLQRGSDGRSVLTRTEVEGRPAVSRTVRLEVLDEAELVNEELQFPGRDRIFEEALDMAAHLLAS